MKKLTLATLLIFSCATAWAADFDKGLAAAEAGDYATALAEWKPLAEQGYAAAQFNLGLLYDNWPRRYSRQCLRAHVVESGGSQWP